MKISRLFLVVTTLALVLLLACTGTASARKKLVFGDDTADDTRKLITAVNVSAGTVVIETMTDEVMHTYNVDLGTVVKVNGVTGNISNIKVGMEVTDMAERDPRTLDTLSVGPASPAPPPPPPVKGKKTPPPQ